MCLRPPLAMARVLLKADTYRARVFPHRSADIHSISCGNQERL
jgi:hypothetical protein